MVAPFLLVSGRNAHCYTPAARPRQLLRGVLSMCAKVMNVRVRDREANPIEDHNNWYKVGIEAHRVDELREYVRATGPPSARSTCTSSALARRSSSARPSTDRLTRAVDNIQP